MAFIKATCKLNHKTVKKENKKKERLGREEERSEKDTDHEKSCFNTQFKNLFHLLSVPKCLFVIGIFFPFPMIDIMLTRS